MMSENELSVILASLSRKRRVAFLSLEQSLQQTVAAMPSKLRNQYLDIRIENADNRGGCRRIWSTGYTPGSRKYPYG